MDKLLWCLKKKRGIRIIEPNENLVKEYLKKAKSALNTMNAAKRIEEIDWVVTTAYYARYFSLYALLMKFGIKSEIHVCSIGVAEFLAKNNILKENLVDEISYAKEMRIDVQYYVSEELNKRRIERNVEQSRKFVLELERITEKIGENQVQLIRKKLQKYFKD